MNTKDGDMSKQCPACERTVENTYECPECDRPHCVDCRLPDAHDCQPPADAEDASSDPDGDTRRYAGLTPLQWLAVPLVWFMAQIGGGAPGQGLAYLSGQVFASFLIVYAGASLIKRVRDR